MFPDSQIGQKFTYDKRKCKYLACNGTAPYSKETSLCQYHILNKSLPEVEHCVSLFDKS